MRRIALLLSLLAPACGSHEPAGTVGSSPPVRSAVGAEEAPRPNLALPTLGGRQVWADVVWRQGWRVQQNVVTGHFRLLDPADVRQAWGSEAACRAELERVAAEQQLAPRSQRLVVLLHGLFRSRHSLDALEQALVAKGYDVASIGYPSTRRSIEESAAQVVRLLAELDGYEEVSFVTHSLGGLVARVLLAPDAPWPDAPRAARLVMLGPPNQGAALAESLDGLALFGWLTGAAGETIANGDARSLPIPRVPFGVIAGGRGDGAGWNPLLEGDDDGVVRVAETELAGAADFLVVPGLHSFLMERDEAVRAIVRFIESGSFD